jgi:hypothetical protein
MMALEAAKDHVSRGTFDMNVPPVPEPPDVLAPDPPDDASPMPPVPPPVPVPPVPSPAAGPFASEAPSSLQPAHHTAKIERRLAAVCFDSTLDGCFRRKVAPESDWELGRMKPEEYFRERSATTDPVEAFAEPANFGQKRDAETPRPSAGLCRSRKLQPGVERAVARRHAATTARACPASSEQRQAPHEFGRSLPQSLLAQHVLHGLY